jgi:hypothetical protein
MAVLLVQALRQLPLGELHPVLLAVLALCLGALVAAYAGIAVALLKRLKRLKQLKRRRPTVAGSEV